MGTEARGRGGKEGGREKGLSLSSLFALCLPASNLAATTSTTATTTTATATTSTVLVPKIPFGDFGIHFFVIKIFPFCFSFIIFSRFRRKNDEIVFSNVSLFVSLLKTKTRWNLRWRFESIMQRSSSLGVKPWN